MDIDLLVEEIGKSLIKLGALKVELIETEQTSKIAKRLIVCSAQNNQISKNIAYDIKDQFKDKIECLHTDGIFKGDWIVLDFKDVIIHIFTKETRQKFNLEKLYKNSNNSISFSAKK